MTVPNSTPATVVAAHAHDSRPLIAAAWMAGVLVSISLLAIAGREALRSMGTFELIFLRNLVALPLIIGWVVLAGPGLAAMRTGRPGLHVVRNFTHAFGQFTWFWALASVPLAHVFALEFTYPLWVVVLAPWLLGERMTLGRAVAVAIGFVGILLVLRPGIAPIGLGLVSAFACAIGYALSIVATKRLTRTDTTLQVVFYMAIVQAAITALPALHAFHPPSLVGWGWVVAAAVTGIFAHVCLTKAVSLADASIVAPMDFLRLPLIIAVGFLVYGEAIDAWVMLGGAVILLANGLNLNADRRRSRLP